MINEKMNELLVLNLLLNEMDTKNIEYKNGFRVIKSTNDTYYNVDKMQDRAKSLAGEFLQPYAID